MPSQFADALPRAEGRDAVSVQAVRGAAAAVQLALSVNGWASLLAVDGPPGTGQVVQLAVVHDILDAADESGPGVSVIPLVGERLVGDAANLQRPVDVQELVERRNGALGFAMRSIECGRLLAVIPVRVYAIVDDDPRGLLSERII